MKWDNAVVDQKLSDRNIKRVGNFTKSTVPVTFECTVCCNTWDATTRLVLGKRQTGCPHCAGTATSTTQQFVTKAVAIHGHKYDYKLVEYTNAKTPVAITCHTHGVFKQTPNSHLSGAGCTLCAGNVLSSNERFDEKLAAAGKGIHRIGQYVQSHHPIMVECVTCLHKWYARPTKLIGKYATGCPKCRTDRGIYGRYVEYDGVSFRSQLERDCYIVVKDFCFTTSQEFETQKKYPQSTTNHTCDFYLPRLNLWIEVSCINTQSYRARLSKKVKWVQELNASFLFVQTAAQLKEILNGKI